MSDLPDQERRPIARKDEHEHANGLTRRTVLAGAAAATAMATVVAVNPPASAQSPDPSSREDLVAFLLLSWALTGIDPKSLSPGLHLVAADPLSSKFGSDPLDMKRDYFKFIVNDSGQGATFAKLLKIVKDNRASPNLAAAIAQNVQASDDTKFLGRSIVLMWYLGAWYDPANLRQAKPAGSFVPFKVISSKAYSQGWIWRIAQAHPMGFSEMQFGYWSRQPADPNDPKGPLAFITNKLS
jgi:hypothetical protein